MGRPDSVSSTQAARERSRHEITSEGKMKGSTKGESKKGDVLLARHIRLM